MIDCNSLPVWATASHCVDEGCSAVFKTTPQDFYVEELLGFAPNGEGEHVFLQLEKTQLNTDFVAKQLSQHLKLPNNSVTYSGLKDRFAVTRQWFGVHCPGHTNKNWAAVIEQVDAKLKCMDEACGLSLIEQGVNQKKLKTGVHKANHFVVRLRQVKGARSIWDEQLKTIERSGFPNYFGPQRFGHSYGNIAPAFRWLERGQRISRHKKSLYISTVRSYFFNEYLYRRIQCQSSDQQSHISLIDNILVGDVVALNGSRSIFEVTDDNFDEVTMRCKQRDLLLTGPMVGEKGPRLATCADEIFFNSAESVEHGLTNNLIEQLTQRLTQLGVKSARRPLLALPQQFQWRWLSDDTTGLDLELSFDLNAGTFATSLFLACGNIESAAQVSGESA